MEAHSILESLVRNRRAAESSTTAAKRSTELPTSVVEGREAVACNKVQEAQLRAGDWVEVRSKEEILGTLDKSGRLEELPFMPQMFEYCGQRFQVFKRAHKTCDPIYSMAGRKLENAVHLELRCDGKAHGGCQVGCLLFWKDAWLKPLKVDGSAASPARIERIGKSSNPAHCSEQDVSSATSRSDVANGEPYTRYVCQTTQLPEFTKPLPWWRPAQYVEDYRSGNTTLPKMARGLFYAIFVRYPTRLAPARYIYNSMQALIGGTRSPVDWGLVPAGRAHPYVDLKLEQGDLVRVKTHQQILTTLDRRNKNRGLYFDVEMVPFCGRVYRVRSRVDRFVDEKTGKMMSLKTPAVILEGVFCGSHLSKRRMFCPRGLHSWWREVWLERVSEAAIGDADPAPCKTLQSQADRLKTAQVGA